MRSLAKHKAFFQLYNRAANSLGYEANPKIIQAEICRWLQLKSHLDIPKAERSKRPQQDFPGRHCVLVFLQLFTEMTEIGRSFSFYLFRRYFLGSSFPSYITNFLSERCSVQDTFHWMKNPEIFSQERESIHLTLDLSLGNARSSFGYGVLYKVLFLFV